MRATASTAQLGRGEVAAGQRDEFAVRSSAEPVFGQGRRVDDRRAAAVIEPGEITEPDRLQLRGADSGAQRPAFVHRGAAGAGVDPADRDHDPLAKHRIQCPAEVHTRQDRRAQPQPGDVCGGLARRRERARRRPRGHDRSVHAPSMPDQVGATSRGRYAPGPGRPAEGRSARAWPRALPGSDPDPAERPPSAARRPAARSAPPGRSGHTHVQPAPARLPSAVRPCLQPPTGQNHHHRGQDRMSC